MHKISKVSYVNTEIQSTYFPFYSLITSNLHLYQYIVINKQQNASFCTEKCFFPNNYVNLAVTEIKRLIAPLFINYCSLEPANVFTLKFLYTCSVPWIIQSVIKEALCTFSPA